jgi:hypothetical protein
MLDRFEAIPEVSVDKSKPQAKRIKKRQGMMSEMFVKGLLEEAQISHNLSKTQVD